MGKAIIFSAPSGSGKSTIVSAVMQEIAGLEFSISATSRAPRGTEVNGKDYYFLAQEEFNRKATNNEFFEWEEVYAGTSYGTLNSELKRIWDKGNAVIFDVDVKGGVNIKEKLKEDAMSIFIKVPSIEILRQRLISRNTDSEESIAKRIDKAAYEMTFADKFDMIIINDDLQTAVKETKAAIIDFLKK